MTILDDLLPSYDVREQHAIRVDASPERVFTALRSVTLVELPVARLLVRLRGINARADRPLLEQMQRHVTTVVEDPGRELVLASIGQPWKLRGGDSPPGDVAAFSEPGYARMALSFEFDGSVLSTETRVLLTDAASRRRFRLYWLAIGPFSALTRRLWLRAVKRRAES